MDFTSFDDLIDDMVRDYSYTHDIYNGRTIDELDNESPFTDYIFGWIDTYIDRKFTINNCIEFIKFTNNTTYKAMKSYMDEYGSLPNFDDENTFYSQLTHHLIYTNINFSDFRDKLEELIDN